MNRFTGIGRIGRDIELKHSGETVYCRFSIAIEDGYGEYKKTNWINCTAFGRIAENTAKYCGKGSLVGVEGRIDVKTREVEDKKVTSWSILCDKVEFLSRKEEQPAEDFEQVEEDIPF